MTVKSAVRWVVLKWPVIGYLERVGDESYHGVEKRMLRTEESCKDMTSSGRRLVV